MQTSDGTPAHVARRVFDETLASMDAGRAVERAVRLDGTRLHVLDEEFDLAGGGFDPAAGGRGLYCVALGKAAAPMAAALGHLLGGRLAAGVVSAPPPAPRLASQLSARWRVFEGGHPLPNEASLAAARACFRLLRRADAEAAPVLFLVSGGGSAMLEWPRDPAITLDELREANRALVACGAAIREVNAVRRAFSSVKGGRLARLAPRSPQFTLIVSDTREGDEHAVASGPTLPPPEGEDAPDAREVVERYGLAARLPASILACLERRDDDDEATPTAPEREEGTPAARDEEAPADHARRRERVPAVSPYEANEADELEADELSVGISRRRGRDFNRAVRQGRHHVLLDNASAVERAAEVARSLGCAVEIARDITDQHVAEGARLLVSRLLELRARAGGDGPVCLVSGGEFSCPVRGAGRGGRSSETALRCALELEARGLASGATGPAPRLALLFAGTDGLDGNSRAAGALCDETTTARARALGLDPQKSLAASDSHSLFKALGDAVTTGHTSTNVRDLRILIAK